MSGQARRWAGVPESTDNWPLQYLLSNYRGLFTGEGKVLLVQLTACPCLNLSERGDRPSRLLGSAVDTHNSDRSIDRPPPSFSPAQAATQFTRATWISLDLRRAASAVP